MTFYISLIVLLLILLQVSYNTIHSQPINDECINAIVVDATSNNNITISGETIGPFPFDYSGAIPMGVWYQDDNTTNHDQMIIGTVCTGVISHNIFVNVYKGVSCNNLEGIGVTFILNPGCTTFKFQNFANDIYRIVITIYDTGNELLIQETFDMTLYSMDSFLPNDETAKAILIDPNMDQVITGNTIASITGYAYYKIDGQNQNYTTISATVCTTNNYNSYYSIDVYDDDFLVNDVFCDNCYIVGRFTTEPDGCSTVYFFQSNYGIYYFQIYIGIIGNEYNLTIRSTQNYFELIDSTKDMGIGLLQTEVYYTPHRPNIGTSKLNIRANFDPNRYVVESVRFTLDNSTRSICERVPPYSLFGDVNGNYKHGTISLGTHVVTATPYSQRSCTGRPAGLSLTQTFHVIGCSLDYEIYDMYGFVDRLYYPGQTMSRVLPCPFNILVTAYCGFEPSVVQFDVRNTDTNITIKRIRDTIRPYELYNGIIGKLNTGRYTMATIIDGIYHLPPFTFIMNETCV